MYAENLIVDHKSPKGNRNEIEGKYMVGLKDIFVAEGGKNRMYKPTYLRTFRYIQLDVITFDDPLVIENYYHVESRAPIELKAEFKTGNELTDWIMDAGWRSVSVCAQDYLLSDAYYEQMQYTGDSRVHNLTLLTLSGDDRLTRNALVQFDQSRIPEGLTYACYPNAFHLVIPSYSLIWIDQVYDYMLWKDDMEFIMQFELGIQNVLHWFEQKMQPNGLLGPMDWWGALAWPRHYKNGNPLQFMKVTIRSTASIMLTRCVMQPVFLHSLAIVRWQGSICIVPIASTVRSTGFVKAMTDFIQSRRKTNR
jgi:alpha-L-rhamnosidase